MGYLDILEWFIEHKKGTAYQIAEDLDMSVAQVFKGISKLEKKSMIELRRTCVHRKMVYKVIRWER